MTAAYEHNGQPCTREQFYAIACDPRRHVAVEACAGAGKTWMLVSRILRALLDGAEPQDILAITFTRKAAGEMRQRLQQWLAEFALATPEQRERELISRGIELSPASDKPEQLQNLYQKLLAHGRPVQIRTFHSWFSALLRSSPLQVLQALGLPAAYELLEDTADAEAEVWRRYLAQVASDEALRADYAALVAELGRTRAHQALQAALDKRVEFGLADAAGHIDEAVTSFDTLYPRLAGVAEPSDWLLTRAAGRALLEDAARALAPLARTFAAKGAELNQALQAGDWDGVVGALFTDKGTPRVFGKSAPPEVRAAQDEVETLRAACQQQAARQHHQRTVRLARPLIDAFARLKRERGWVDMGDVERAALTLLSDPFLSGWTQERLDMRVRHLLIDEFQDTSPLQWQALHAWLAGYGGAGGGAGAPSVFIVGDPKQSIYRFRRADPRVFAAAQDFITQALDGDRLACDHTRRNTPAVLAAVNAVMSQAQAAGEFSGYRTHTTESTDADGQVGALLLIPRPERAAAGAGDDAAADWRDSLDTPRVALEDSLRTLEARQAARWIAAQVAGGTPARELMVLSRKREPLGVLQAELRALGIPCEQPEQQILGQLPVVQDLLALVDALVSPGHDLSLARALRSPLFGLAEDDLTRIALAVRAAGEPRPAWLEVLAQIELTGADAVSLHAELQGHRQAFLHLPPHDALQALYQQRDVLARYAAAAPPPERAHQLGQLRALLGAALQVQGGRYLTAYQWVRALRRQRLAAPRHADPDSVQLLTVHGAKGLEADAVLLLNAAADPEGRAGGPAVLIDWPGEAPVPRRLALLANAAAPPPSLVELARQEAEAQAREELNALYVAMTRARRRLVLSGVTPYREPPVSWWRSIAPLAEALPTPLDAPARHALAGADQVQVLDLPLAGVDSSEGAIENVVNEGADDTAPTESSRTGEAMHWLLQHAGDTPAGWHSGRVAQAGQRFALDAAGLTRAEQLARRILTGQGAWAWSAEEVLEAFDEVELIHQGQRLRIDRLVRRRASGSEPERWWVLDYKSAAHPERDPDLVAQLARYRAAVAAVYPGQAVRAAFLDGEGRMVGG